jgi:hypothetical protein
MIISTLTGEVVLTKQCIKCGEYKSLFDFKSRSEATKHLPNVERRNECGECAKKMRRELNQIKKYAPKTENDHTCPICKRSADQLNKRKFVYDHDHETKLFRGIICDDCNGGLGKFYDDIERLEAAIEYLKRSK